MCENIFKELLGEMIESELAEFDNLPDRKPSLRHRIAMKRIFARYETNKLKENERTTAALPPSRLNFKQRIILALVIVLLMTLLVGWVAVFISKDFHGIVYADNTHLFAVNTENAPTIIEYQYTLDHIPEGFELIKTVSSPTFVYTYYLNNSTEQTIVLEQSVKLDYDPHYDNERGKFEEFNINGKTGLFIDFSTEKLNSSTFIWDNGDYIIEISLDLDKNSAADLLEINKVLENQQVIQN